MNLDEKKQQYLTMRIDPACQLSQKEYAEQLGVGLRTIQRWERQIKDNKATGEKKKINQEEREWNTLRDVVYQKALEGDVPAAKLLLQMREMNLHPEQNRGITVEEALILIQNHLNPDRKHSPKTGSEN